MAKPEPQPDHQLVLLRDYIEGDPLLDLTTACKTFAARLAEMGNTLAAAQVESAARRACHEVSLAVRRGVRWSATTRGE